MAIASFTPVSPNQKKQCRKIARFTDAPASISQKIWKESKAHPRTGHEGPDGSSSTLSLTSDRTIPAKKKASIFGNLDLMIMMYPPIHVTHWVILAQFAHISCVKA